MADRELTNAIPGTVPIHQDVQQIIEAIRGQGKQGVRRAWQASDSAKIVLTSTAAGVKISRDNGTTPPAQVIVDGTAAGGQLAGTYPNPSLSVGTIDALLPPGTIWPTAAAAIPAGWLPCDGTGRSTTLYAKLFAAIGYAYGGAGATFNLPDLRGRVLLGVGGAHARGQVGGAETVSGPTHTHPGSHSHGMNSHTHGPGLHTHTLGSHTHGPGSHTHGPGLHTHTLGTHTHDSAAHTHSAGSHSHDISGHNHQIGGHAHLPGAHYHDIGGHYHGVDLNHDHGSAVGAAAASATGLNGRFVAGGATALPDNHTHPVDLPPLGITAINSGTSHTAGFDTTGTPSSDNSGTIFGTPVTSTSGVAGFNDTGLPGGVSPNTGGVVSGSATTSPPTPGPTNVSDGPLASANTDGPTANDTAGPTAGPTNLSDTPSSAVTAAATGVTATDSTAPVADYAGVTVPSMPPFQVVSYMIWPGA